MKKIILGLLILNFIFSWGLLKPIDGATLNQTHVLFEWEQQPNNAFYVLTVSEDIEFQECIICEQYIDESLIYIAKDMLNWNTQYWWKITAYDNNNQLISQIHELNIGASIANTTANIYNEDLQEKGLTIFGSFFDYYSAVIDQNGNEIWNSGNQDLIFYNTDKYGRFFGSEFIGNNAENNYPGVKFSFENGIEWQEPGTNFIHHDIFQLPNGNYIGLGTLYVPPSVHIKVCEPGMDDKFFSLKVDEGIPYRTLTYPAPPSKKPRDSPMFYFSEPQEVRSQETILRQSGYPVTNEMPDNFWGLKPPC